MNKVTIVWGLFLCISTSCVHSVMVIGHRGACGYAPGNTVASFAKAIECGVDMIELDVRLCKSGELVVIHDKKVDKISNGTGYVADKTLQELQALDAGDGQHIPTLGQVLNFIGRQVKVNIEIKEVDTIEKVLDTINHYVTKKGWHHIDFLISSFWHAEIQRCKQSNPLMPVGLLMTGRPIDLAAFADAVNPEVVIMYHEFIDKAFVDDAHRHGRLVFVFTVNNSREINDMIALGVDGIVTDYPDRVHAALAYK